MKTTNERQPTSLAFSQGENEDLIVYDLHERTFWIKTSNLPGGMLSVGLGLRMRVFECGLYTEFEDALSICKPETQQMLRDMKRMAESTPLMQKWAGKP